MGYKHLEKKQGGAESDGGRRGRRAVRDIGIVVFDGFSLLTVGVIPELFEMANEIHTPRSKNNSLYDIRFYSADGGGVACSSAVSVWTYACDVRNASGFDALFIAGGVGAERAASDARVTDWLRSVMPLSDVVKAIGTGRMLIEAAGSTGSKLNGGNAEMTTIEGVDSMSDAHLADDRGEPAKTALTLIESDLGGEVAREIAARLSLGSAAPAMSVPAAGKPVTAAEKVRASARWLKQNCERAISVSDAVSVAEMSERNFLRCFKREIGVTPSEFLIQVRLERTAQLLTETDLPIDKIARRCGWVNGDRLAKIFRKRLAVTPSAYRIRNRSRTPESTS